MENKTYKAHIVCNNCKLGYTEAYTINIPLGLTISQYIYNKVCKYCECKTISPKLHKDEQSCLK